MIGCAWPAARADRRVSVDVRDLGHELERDLLVVVHARLDLDLDADVLYWNDVIGTTFEPVDGRRC
jgi:hypothetical protein